MDNIDKEYELLRNEIENNRTREISTNNFTIPAAAALIAAGFTTKNAFVFLTPLLPLSIAVNQIVFSTYSVRRKATFLRVFKEAYTKAVWETYLYLHLFNGKSSSNSAENNNTLKSQAYRLNTESFLKIIFLIGWVSIILSAITAIIGLVNRESSFIYFVLEEILVYLAFLFWLVFTSKSFSTLTRLWSDDYNNELEEATINIYAQIEQEKQRVRDAVNVKKIELDKRTNGAGDLNGENLTQDNQIDQIVTLTKSEL